MPSLKRKDVQQAVVIEDLGQRPVWAAELTDSEYVFVEVYLAHFKIGVAAAAAGLDASYGSTVIRRSHVKRAIDGALQERFNTTKASLAEVLADMAFADPRRVLSWDANGKVKVKRSKDLTTADWRMIAGVKSHKDGTVEIKLVDRMAAVEKLAKLLGVMRELPEADSGGGVLFVVGDPEVVLREYRAERLKLIEGTTDAGQQPAGEHNDLNVVEPV